MTVAALFVETGGSYWNLPGVDPWDEVRDARTYAGPWPVVAHPPCQRWGKLWAGQPLWIKRTGERKIKGDDGGCFKRALWSARTFGGVLEHPEGSHAWVHFGLNRPPRAGGGSLPTFAEAGPAASSRAGMATTLASRPGSTRWAAICRSWTGASASRHSRPKRSRNTGWPTASAPGSWRSRAAARTTIIASAPRPNSARSCWIWPAAPPDARQPNDPTARYPGPTRSSCRLRL